MKSFERLIRSHDWRSSGKWGALSIGVGVIAGIGAIVFQWLGQAVVHYALYAVTGYAPLEAAGEAASFAHDSGEFQVWLIVVVMTVGGLVSGVITYTFAPEAEGHGTDAAIHAFHHRRGLVRGRIPIIKTITSAITIGTGGSAGREGPIAQIGAGFGSFLATTLGLSARDRRILLAAGMGAGVGSIFRAPLAGALFAAEILYSEADLESDVIIPAATSSIIGYSVYCLSLPEEVRYLPLFGGELNYASTSPLELAPYGLMAMLLVAAAVAYIKVFYGTHRLFARLKLPRHVRPAIGAALAGLIGVAMYYAFDSDRRALAVLSTGYGTLQQALTGASQVGIPLLLAVALIKIVTTSLTISSGGSGGVFGPSMVIGGCIGSAVGLCFHRIWPELVPHPEAFGIVGMAGFFSACAHAPFSTIIMVSEMTGGYELLLPTMWVSTLCFLMGRRWRLYQQQVPSRLDSPAHRGDFLVDVLEGIRVGDVYDHHREVVRIPEATPLKNILQTLAATQQHFFPVVDDQGKMIGIFSGDDVRAYLYNESIWQLAVARDVMTTSIVAVTPDDDLNTALRCFTAIATDELPVVDAADRAVLRGTLTHKEAITSYNRRLTEFQQAAEEG